MQQEELKQKIAEYYQKLPENLQQYFSGLTWLESLKDISKKNNLNEEQTENLITETTILLLCIIGFEEYVNTLKESIKDEGIIKNVFSEIDEKILKDIDEDLEENYNYNLDDLLDEKMEKSDINQNVNFILSGGDYSHFLDEKNNFEVNIDKKEEVEVKPEMELENFNLEITDGKTHFNL